MNIFADKIWLSKEAPVFANIVRITQLVEQITMQPLRNVTVSQNVWDSFLVNTQLNEIGGTVNNASLDANEEYKVIKAIPWLKWKVLPDTNNELIFSSAYSGWSLKIDLNNV